MNKNSFAASFALLFQVSMVLPDRAVLQTKNETFALTLHRYGYRSTLCGTICDYSWLALPLAGYVVMMWGCYIAYATPPGKKNHGQNGKNGVPVALKL